jgi:vacuolar-type H+-ATPase catalytic subunit A/Vma1
MVSSMYAAVNKGQMDQLANLQQVLKQEREAQVLEQAAHAQALQDRDNTIHDMQERNVQMFTTQNGVQRMALWHALMHKVYAYCAQHTEIGVEGPDGVMVGLLAEEVIQAYRDVQGDMDYLRAQPGDSIWLADAYQLWKQDGTEPAFKDY